uniref:Sialic acid-binding Ig-like lectin 12 n=1 Tax=Podarcis muralis TaxID=64176 RepID=A0A670IGV6_PODMU|nr:sialic acid-binding Ig-like lectin 12 [Podarcis muralis]
MMEAENSWQVANPSSKTKGLASSLATVATLILALLCKGVLAQHLDFSIRVAQTITVQKGFCAYVACSFTTPRWFMEKSGPLYAFWLKDADKSHSWIWPGYWIPGKIVCTNNKNQNLTTTHFKLTGDPKTGDCSFSIKNMGPEDVGWYYLRIEKGEGFSFLSFRKRIHTQPQIFLTDLTKPTIAKPSEAVWRKPATFRCFLPGVCPGSISQINWNANLKYHVKHFWQRTVGNWSKTYGADITFTPSLDDEGKFLTCSVRYPNSMKTIYQSTRVAFGYPPEATTTKGSTACQYEKKGHLCFCSIHSWPPSKIEWHVDGKLVNETVRSEAMKLFSWVDGNTVTSTLSWPGDLDGQKMPLITCTGANKYGVVTVNVPSELNATSTGAVTRSPQNDKTELSSGMISGIVFGVIAALAISGGILYSFLAFCRRDTNVPVI